VATQPVSHVSAEEYLRLEREADVKHEYVNGQIVAMGGGSPRHSLVTANVLTELNVRLRDTPYAVHTADLRVWVREDRLITYPDVTVLCGPPEYFDERRDTVVNPMVIVEVLSPTTRAFDRGEKAYLYRQVPSVREYLLVDPDSTNVEHYRRAGGEWILKSYTDVSEVIPLESIGIELPAAAIYRRVELYQ
jgi:Uma2 family endonuclease